MRRGVSIGRGGRQHWTYRYVMVVPSMRRWPSGSSPAQVDRRYALCVCLINHQVDMGIGEAVCTYGCASDNVICRVDILLHIAAYLLLHTAAYWTDIPLPIALHIETY